MTPSVASVGTSPIERVLARLDPQHLRESRGEYSARCPAHPDRNPSLTIREGDDGRALLCCHSGCSVEDVVAALDLTMADLAPPSSNGVAPISKPRPVPQRPTRTFASVEDIVKVATKRGETLVAAFVYRDADGDDVGAVLRFSTNDGKRITQTRCVDGRWSFGGLPRPAPLFRLPELLEAEADEPVVLLEGEQKADLAASLGFVATSCSGGAGKGNLTALEPLAGRDVVLLADHDDAGRAHVEDLAERLRRIKACSVLLATLPDLGPKEDIVDYVERRRASGWDDERIRQEIAGVVAMADEMPEEKEPDSETPAATADSETPAESAESVAQVRTLADIEPREIRWLWPGRIARGRITLLVGVPGAGKSFMMADVAARLSAGRQWPDGGACERGNVLLISAEDDPADTIRPRLDANGADVRRVQLLTMVKRGAASKRREIPFTLEDVDALEETLVRFPGTKLIVIDPIGSFLGGQTDAHRDNGVRAVLAPVAALAEKYDVAVLVVCHKRKGVAGNADETAMGSVGFVGLARQVWHLSADTKNADRRLLLPGKSNLAKRAEGLAFTIAGNPAAVQWESQPVAMTADEALAEERSAQSRRGPDRQAREQAASWLEQYLDGRWRSVAEVKNAAESEGHSFRTVERAKKDLGVRSRRRFDGGREWGMSE